MGDSNVAFVSADMALSSDEVPNTLNILLMADEQGLPGTTPHTMLWTDILSSPTLVTVKATAPVTLAANTSYWLATDCPVGFNGG